LNMLDPLVRRTWIKEFVLTQRSEEHTSELQSHLNLVCRLLLEKKKKNSKACIVHESEMYDVFITRTYACVLCAVHQVLLFLCAILSIVSIGIYFFFFFNDTATTEIYPLSLHDALPISAASKPARQSFMLCGRTEKVTRPYH